MLKPPVSDQLSATKPFDRFSLNPIKHYLWNVAKQVWFSEKPAAWQSPFSHERTYTPKGKICVSWQIVVRFGLVNLRSVLLSTYDYCVSRDRERQFTLWRKWISTQTSYIFADLDNIGTKALHAVSLNNFGVTKNSVYWNHILHIDVNEILPGHYKFL
jgi:hypothetical protein